MQKVLLPTRQIESLWRTSTEEYFWDPELEVIIDSQNYQGIPPIPVIEVPENLRNKKRIYCLGGDGHHRLTSCNLPEIPCVLYDHTDDINLVIQETGDATEYFLIIKSLWEKRFSNNIYPPRKYISLSRLHTYFDDLEKTNKLCDDEGVNLLHNNFEYPWNLRPLFIIDTKFDKQNSIITINSEKKWEGFDDYNYKIEMVYGETGFELFVEMEGIFLEDLIPDLFTDERKIQLRDIYEFLEVSGKDFIKNVSGKDPSVVEKLLETKFDLDCTFYALITHMIPEVKYYPNLL